MTLVSMLIASGKLASCGRLTFGNRKTLPSVIPRLLQRLNEEVTRALLLVARDYCWTLFSQSEFMKILDSLVLIS